MKKNYSKLFLSILATAFLVACSSGNADVESSSKGAANPEGNESQKRVAVVVNQRFGDNGPMDNLAEGIERAKRRFWY